jgi:DNA-binding NarL/FixJ family response regulator
VLRQVGARGGAKRAAAERAPISLTPRESSVLQHLARGRSNKQIAAALGVSERTVKFHVSTLFTKLGATNRTEAVTRAIQAGLASL